MLKLERISKYYFTGNQVVQALRRINLECGLGEFIAITGESGSGKSTLLNVMSGLDTYEEGVLYFHGEDLSHYTLNELEKFRRESIGYVFQEYNIIDSYTVAQNIEAALIIQGYPKEKRKARIRELIDLVGLTSVGNLRVGKLSGGEKQRTVIARTLAKEYQILVCDEPTGNLSEDAAKGIFALLRTISKDKLVVVVTHDVRLVSQYATRKIRLYDGEIVEDTILPREAAPLASDFIPAVSKPSRLGMLSIGLRNLLSVPKKTFFSLFTFVFILTMVFFVYAAGAVETNQSYRTENPYFVNPSPTRIILTKGDSTAFSAAEMTVIGEIKDVRGVYHGDSLFDSIFLSKDLDDVSLMPVFHRFHPLSALALETEDILVGRLPNAANEIVIGDHGEYELGEELLLANADKLSPSSLLQTDQYSFRIVGFVFERLIEPDDIRSMHLTSEGLDLLVGSSVQQRSEIEFQVYGTQEYDTPSGQWVMPADDPDVGIDLRTYVLSYPIWIEKDESLVNGEMRVFDMLFFDICRDFGYKKEIRDDFDAGLCDANQFIAHHEITFRANTPYENDNEFAPLTLISVAATDDDQSLKLYMNSATYDTYFGEKGYQISVVVKDMYEGKLVANELKSLGYEVFYPALIVDQETEIYLLVRNGLIIVLVAILLFAIDYVGYFVIRNLVLSKQKDYLIFRSLGTSKRNLRHILRTELYGLALLGGGIVALIVGLGKDEWTYLRLLVRYVQWFDYLILGLMMILVLERMVAAFSKRIFLTSVVAALKGAER